MTDEYKENIHTKNLHSDSNTESWEESTQKPQIIDCNISYDIIISAMVDYNPRDRYNLYAKDPSGRPLNINPDMSIRINKGPILPNEIQKHVNQCSFCQRLIKQLSGLQLARGELAIISNLSHTKTAYSSDNFMRKQMITDGWRPKRDKFKGTPDKIIEGMVRDACQYMRPEDKAAFMDRKHKFIKHILSIVNYQPEVKEDGSIEITDIEFLQAIIQNGAAEIIADPWFVLASRPTNIRALSGES